MQNCPSCQMLMEDDEILCSTCAPPAAPAPVGAARELSGTAATALLERPTAVPMPTTVRYRQPGSHRRTVKLVVVVLALLAAVVAVVVLALRGEGPVARAAVDAGLVAAPVVSVPDTWATKVSDAGAFRISMPQGASALEGMVDAQNPAAGSTFGFQFGFGDGGSTAVVSTDFGMAPGALGAMDDPAAFNGMVDSMVAGLVGMTGSGEETVRREVPVGNGRAVDLVVVDESAGTTTRARYLLANGRMYAVVTSGLDAGAEDLDEVHSRMLGSFEAIS